MKIRIHYLLMVGLIFSLTTTSAEAQYQRWDPYLELEGRAGGGPERGQTRTFLPVYQDNLNLIFGDVRVLYTDDGSWEGNFGVGYRHILNNRRLFGAYGFYDVKESRHDNVFHQGTVGMELLDIDWGLRTNAYIPDGSAQAAPGANAILQGNQIFVQGNQERAYHGFDVEAEHILWRGWDVLRKYRNTDFELWAAGGYFYFNNKADGFTEINGPRARLEARLYDLPYLGNDSRLVFSGQYEYDEVRGSVGQGFVNVRIPLGPCGTRKPTKLNLLDRRMVTPIVRDIDIITNVARAGNLDLAENLKTGTVLDDVVTLTALDDVQNLIQTGPDGRTYILDGVDGDFDLNSVITLNNEQILLGGGGSMTVIGQNTGMVATFTAAGERFGFNQTNNVANVINLANNNGIYGLTLTGGNNTIAGTNVTHFDIVGNTFLNAGDDFIDLNITAGSSFGCIIGNTFDGSGGNGLEFDIRNAADLDVRVYANTFSNINGNAIDLDARQTSTAALDARFNTFEGGNQNGIFIEGRNSAQVDSVIANNDFIDIPDSAIRIEGQNSATLNTSVLANLFLGNGVTNNGVDMFVNNALNNSVNASLTVYGNRFEQIQNNAINVNAGSFASFGMNPTLELLIAQNQIIGDGITANGINLGMTGGITGTANLFASILNNRIHDVTDNGINLGLTGRTNSEVTIHQNRILANGITQNGINVTQAGLVGASPSLDLLVSNNTIREATDNAFNLTMGGASQSNVRLLNNLVQGTGITQNGINATLNGFVLNEPSLELLVSGNNIRGLIGDGVSLDATAADVIAEVSNNRFIRIGDTAVRVESNDGLLTSASLNLVVLDNYGKWVGSGVDLVTDMNNAAFATIGGNTFRGVTGTGIFIDAISTLNLDDNGQNNRVLVRQAGVPFDINGDVVGSIRINHVDQVFP